MRTFAALKKNPFQAKAFDSGTWHTIMEYVIMGLQLLLSLSILIVLHEFGHFLPARWFKTRVEKFYLFFDPWFSVFKFKRGDTEYGIGWLPLGGYVKISGMIDESMDKEQMKQPPKPYEFRSKPAWQRLIIMLGGVTVNFILGFLFFALVLFVWGQEYLPAKNLTYGIAVDSLAAEFGLQDGDKILSLDGKEVERFGDIRRGMFMDDPETIEVMRHGRTEVLNVPPGLSSRLGNYRGMFVSPRIPMVIADIPESSHNADSGLRQGDRIVSVAGNPALYFHEVAAELQKHTQSEIEIGVLRGRDTARVAVIINEHGQIGVLTQSMGHFFELERLEYSLLGSIPAGIQEGWDFLVNIYIRSLGKLFDGSVKATESLGGFGTIGSMFGGVWEWERFWRMTAILSLILAFMNLLPIPALDGGHVMFLFYEIITGRKPSDKFMEVMTIIGFIIVLGLVILANGLDIIRAFR